MPERKAQAGMLIGNPRLPPAQLPGPRLLTGSSERELAAPGGQEFLLCSYRFANPCYAEILDQLRWRRNGKRSAMTGSGERERPGPLAGRGSSSLGTAISCFGCDLARALPAGAGAEKGTGDGVVKLRRTRDAAGRGLAPADRPRHRPDGGSNRLHHAPARGARGPGISSKTPLSGGLRRPRGRSRQAQS